MDDEGDLRCCMHIVACPTVRNAPTGSHAQHQPCSRPETVLQPAHPPWRIFAAGTTFAIVPHPSAQPVCVVGSSPQNSSDAAVGKPIESSVATQSLVFARIDGVPAEAEPEQQRRLPVGASASDAEAQDGMQSATEAPMLMAPVEAQGTLQASAAVAPRETSKARCCPDALFDEWLHALPPSGHHVCAGGRPQKKQEEEESRSTTVMAEDGSVRTQMRYVSTCMAIRVASSHPERSC